jgi:Asp-tRNA(Asn)/Glu-tRNA(Gln) amidotransferase A subunit family amidase
LAEKSDKKKLKAMRVGLLESSALPKATPETEAAVAKAAKFLEGAGMVVEPVRLGGLDRALENWWFFFGPVVAHLFEPTIAGHGDELSPIFREYMEVARSKKPLTLDEVLDARAQRDWIRAEVLEQLRDWPILLSGVSAKPAFRHGEGSYQPGAAECYRDTMRHSQWLNLVGLPGASVPVGSSVEGLPIGVQVIGQPFEEELVLTVAEQIEQARGPWQPPPI